MEMYFKLKFIGELAMIGLVLLILLVLFVAKMIVTLKASRIEKYLVSIGYKRELISTASFGTNHTYGYRRTKEDGELDVIRDYELKGMTLKQIKEKYQ